MSTWMDLPAGTGFGLANLPLGVFSPDRQGEPEAKAGGDAHECSEQSEPERKVSGDAHECSEQREAERKASGDAHECSEQSEPERKASGDAYECSEQRGRRTGVAIGDHVIDLAGLTGDQVHATGSLNAFLARGPQAWAELRRRLTEWLTDPGHRAAVEPHLRPRDAVTMHLPVEVGDYVDFYSSQHHAENLGRMFRPGQPALTPNWKHLPIGYHGRSGTVRVSGTPVRRPLGQQKDAAFGPSQRLDIEAEVGFVVGMPSRLGEPVPVAGFAEHVFGVCLVNDWSARDIQAWEYVPLGPFLGKSFLTSVSPWVVPLAALEHARIAPPPRDTPVLPYLDDDGARWGLDLTLEVRLNGELLSSPPAGLLHWTAAQQLAHMTINGASLRTGDLFASGTVSGPDRDQRGSLIELSWNGAEPIKLADGGTRTFLEDGDVVTITASAPGPDGERISFGEVTGRVEPAGAGEVTGPVEPARAGEVTGRVEPAP